MTRMRVWTMVLLLGWCGLATAAGVRDLRSAWLVDGPRTLELLREARSPEPGWWLETRQGRLFGLETLPQLGLALARDRGRWSVSASWERLGDGLVREDAARLAIRRRGPWSVGAGVTLVRLSLAGEAAGRHADPSLLVVWTPTASARLRLDWPLAAPPPWFGTRGLRSWLAVDGRGKAVAWSIDLARRGDGTPVLGAEGLLRLGPGVGWGWRWDAASGSLGLITAWRRGRLLVRSVHLAHRDLGLTHRWSVGVAP